MIARAPASLTSAGVVVIILSNNAGMFLLSSNSRLSKAISVYGVSMSEADRAFVRNLSMVFIML